MTTHDTISAMPRATELYSGNPYWLARDASSEIGDSLPTTVDVVVVGSGITGALIADALTAAGLSVAVIDRRTVADGSTTASTALLLYELDVELGQLIRRIGKPKAAQAYRRISAALTQLDTLVRELSEDVGFHWRDSLYIASRLNHLWRLRRETALLQQAGLDATWLTSAELRGHHGIEAVGAIHTTQAAGVDPVRLARALLRRARQRGATVSDLTTVTSFRERSDGVDVITDRGVVQAQWCVSAMGYETPPGLTAPPITLHSSYAFVSEPIEDLGPLANGTLYWESNRPYFYARTTEDRRLMVGGADVRFKDPARRDALLPLRQHILERMAHAWFPTVQFQVASSWCGTFAETADGLPCIGALPGAPRVLLALCAGGNGIPFAMVAADLLTAHCLGRSDPDAALFDPSRIS